MRANKNLSIWESALYTQGGAETDWKEYNTSIQFTPVPASDFTKDYAILPYTTDKIIVKKQDNSYQLINPTEYNGSIGWALVKTASLGVTYSGYTSQESAPRQVKFSFDGTKMYVLGTTNRTVYQYTLSTPWAVNTATYASKSFSVSSTAGSFSIAGLAFSTDGTKFYVASNSTSKVHQYNMSTPWDISTASYSNKDSGTVTATYPPYGISFSPDGRIMYGVYSTAIRQWALSTAWDISTISYSNKSLTTNSGGLTENSSYDVVINNSGTILFFTGDSTDDVYQVMLTTPFDLATAQTSSTYIVSYLHAPTATSSSIAISSDGLKMFIFTSSNTIDTINLTQTPGSIAFAGVACDTGENLYFGGQNSNAYGSCISADGANVYVCSNSGGTIYQYTLSNPFILSSGSYASKSLTLGASLYNIQISPDGKYLIGHRLSGNRIDQYLLTTPFDISTGVLIESLYNTTYIANGTYYGMFMSPDGTNLYTVTNGTYINRFTLSNPWHISSAEFVSSTSGVSASLGLWFSIDGKTMITESSGTLYSCRLSTPWDPNSYTYVDSYGITSATGTGYTKCYISQCGRFIYANGQSSTYPNVRRAFFKNHSNLGSKAYLISQTELPKAVYYSIPEAKIVATVNSAECLVKYDAYPIVSSTPNSIVLDYDNTEDNILSAGNTVKYNTVYGYNLSNGVNSQVSYSNTSYPSADWQGIFLSSDGTKLYASGTSSVAEFSLSKPYNVSSATYSTSFTTSGQDTSGSGIYFSTDGTKMYMIGQTNDTVYQYTLSTAWSISSASYASKSFSVTAQTGGVSHGVCFSYDGSKMYVTKGDTFYQYNLSTAWDVSTASYASKSLTVSAQSSSTFNLDISRDGLTIVGCAAGTLYQYNLTTPFDLNTASYASKALALGAGTSFGVHIPKEYPNLVYIGTNAYYIYQGCVSFSSIDVPATISNISVSGGQTTVTFDSNIYPYNVKIQANKTYEVFDSLTESGTDLIATGGKTIFPSGKRNIKIRVDGNQGDTVTAVTTNLWKL